MMQFIKSGSSGLMRQSEERRHETSLKIKVKESESYKFECMRQQWGNCDNVADCHLHEWREFFCSSLSKANIVAVLRSL